MAKNINLDKVVNDYVNKVAEALKKDPKALTDMEKRVANRAEDNRAAAVKCQEEINKLNDQILQAQSRVRSLELQSQAALGKASGLYESLAIDKFNLDTEPEVTPESMEEQQEEQAEANA